MCFVHIAMCVSFLPRLQQIISFVEQSSPVTLLTKLLLCFSPSGISPFWTTQPGPGCKSQSSHNTRPFPIPEIIFSNHRPPPSPLSSLFSSHSLYVPSIHVVSDFGWLNDPVLLEVQSILDVLYAQTGLQVPWTSAVPGSLANYSTEADARRRKAKNVMKTGQKDLKQVAKFVRFVQLSFL